MRRVEVFKHLVHCGRGHGPVGVLLRGTQPGRQGGFILRGGDRRPQAVLDGRGLGVVQEEAALRVAVGGGHRRAPRCVEEARQGEADREVVRADHLGVCHAASPDALPQGPRQEELVDQEGTSYDREVTSKSYLPTMNGSLVQIKDFMAEIHVFKETKNQFALVRNNTPNFVETNGQSLPVVALWLDSRKSKTDEIEFFDVNLYEPSLSEAFQHARINKPPNTVNSKVRIDVSIKTLRAFYEESKVLNQKIQGDFSRTDKRIMQTGFNRAFGGLSDVASINSSNAFYPLGGMLRMKNLKQPPLHLRLSPKTNGPFRKTQSACPVTHA